MPDKREQLLDIMQVAAEAKSKEDLYAENAALKAENERLRSEALSRTGAVKDGLAKAVGFVRKRCDDYVSEHGMTDPATGTVEFPGNGDEYVAELEEIIEGLEALSALEPAAPEGEPHPMGPKQTIIQEVWERLEGPHGLMRNVDRAIVEQGVEIALHILRRDGITLGSFLTRPAEQAVTEAAVDAFGHTYYGAAWPIERKAGRGTDIRAALKATMEAGR